MDNMTEPVMPAVEAQPYLSAIVEYWLGQYQSAYDDRKTFMLLGDQCQEFFTGTGRQFWGDVTQQGTVASGAHGYFGDSFARPKFRMWVAKAFEFIAVIAPQLFWQSPRRLVTPRHDRTPSEQLMALMGMIDQQLGEQAMQLHQQESLPSQVRCQILEQVLNATALHGIGLAANSELSITEMMIRGRGLLEPVVEECPGAGRRITGLKHLGLRHFFIDPDCKECTLDSAKYIMITRREAWWDVEKKFGLPSGMMRDRATSISETNRTGSVSIVGGSDTNTANQSKDMVEYVEVYSKMGLGAQCVSYDAVTHALDGVVGKYVYLALCPGVPHPLNVPPDATLASLSDEEIRERFRWKTPHWRSKRWPVAILDVHPLPNSPYPLPVFSQVIGELVALNVLSSILVTRAHATTQEIIAVLGEYEQAVKTTIASGESPAFVKIMADTGRSINDVVGFLQRPDLTNSLMEGIRWLQETIDKKTGLVPHQYAVQQGPQSRSAADVQLRDEKASIRPEHMRRQIAEWQTIAAQLELTEMVNHLTGEDVKPMIGDLASQAWDLLVAAADKDTVVFDMQCSVEAADMERPNKPRQADILQSLSNIILPALDRYGQTYGNYEPFNKYIGAIGHLMEIDTEEFALPPPPQPEADPEQQAMQQQAQELQTRTMSAQAAAAEAKAQLTQVNAQVAAEMGAVNVAGAQQKMQIDGDLATVKTLAELVKINQTEVVE